MELVARDCLGMRSVHQQQNQRSRMRHVGSQRGKFSFPPRLRGPMGRILLRQEISICLRDEMQTTESQRESWKACQPAASRCDHAKEMFPGKR